MQPGGSGRGLALACCAALAFLAQGSLWAADVAATGQQSADPGHTALPAWSAYYDALRHAIEERGNGNFPQSGGKSLYGELTMAIHVHHDGRVLSTQIVKSSGHARLDRQAIAIARAAGPFGPFPPAMRSRADQLLVISRFTFSSDKTLQATIPARP